MYLRQLFFVTLSNSGDAHYIIISNHMYSHQIHVSKSFHTFMSHDDPLHLICQSSSIPEVTTHPSFSSNTYSSNKNSEERRRRRKITSTSVVNRLVCGEQREYRTEHNKTKTSESKDPSQANSTVLKLGLISSNNSLERGRSRGLEDKALLTAVIPVGSSRSGIDGNTSSNDSCGGFP